MQFARIGAFLAYPQGEPSRARCRALNRPPALRRRMSTRFVREGRLKVGRNSTTCKLAMDRFTLARNRRKHCVSNRDVPVAQVEKRQKASRLGHAARFALGHREASQGIDGEETGFLQSSIPSIPQYPYSHSIIFSLKRSSTIFPAVRNLRS